MPDPPADQGGGGVGAETADRDRIKRTLARNTVWNYLGFGTNLVTNLVLFPFVVSHIGDAAAGLWLLLSSITGYMGLLELGIVPALTQHVGASIGRRAMQDASKAASSATLLLLALALVALQVLWFVPALIEILHVPPDLLHEATRVVSVCIIGFVLKMPLAVLQALLLGSQRQDRCSQLWILQAVVRAIATFLLISLGYGVLGIVLAEAAIPLAGGVLQFKWVRSELPDLRVSFRLIDFERARSILTMGATLFAGSICALVIEQTDRLVIAGFLPIGQVTHYSAAWKLYAMVFAVATTLVQAVAPVAAELHGRSDLGSLRTLLFRTTKYSAAVALPLAISTAFCGSALLKLWMGPGFADAGYCVLALCAAFAVTAYNHVGYSVLIGMRRIGPYLWLYSVPQAVLNLVLSLMLVQPLGILGVAAGTAIPALVLEAPFLVLMFRELNIRATDFFKTVVWPTAGPAALAFLPLALAYAALPATSVALLAIALGCGLAYAALFVWVFTARDERRDIAQLVLRPVRAGAQSVR